jgi:hypothetical protein
VLSSLIAIIAINTINLGIGFGPNIPIGGIAQNYKTTTTATIFCTVNNFGIDYAYSKFTNKQINADNITIHTATISYFYPLVEKETHQMDIVLGGNYNRIIHKFELGSENSYVFGLRYGLNYQEIIQGSQSIDRLKPTLSGRILINQYIQTRNWNYTQITSSIFTVSLVLCISFRIL